MSYDFRQEKLPVLDTLVLNTVAATAGDVSLAKGIIAFAGLGTAIPLKDLESGTGITPYRVRAYSAGVAQVSTITIGLSAITTGKVYTFQIFKNALFKPSLENNENNMYEGVETYAVQAVTGDTNATIATKFQTLIASAFAKGASYVNATVATATITLTAKDAYATFQVVASYDTSLISAFATTTANTPPSGSYEEVVRYNKSAVSGNTYTAYEFTMWKWYDGQELNHSGGTKRLGRILVFANSASANLAALTTQVNAIIGGTATPVANYLGA
jgi:hypothetical protein